MERNNKMSELFCAEWMNALKDEWNGDPGVADKLAEIGFSSVICCGYKEEDEPRGVFTVVDGVCVSAGDWDGEVADWDMRANPKDWKKWVSKVSSRGIMPSMVLRTGFM